MEPVSETKPLLHLNLGLAATPVITFIKSGGIAQTVPTSPANAATGFSLELEATVRYEALSNLLQTYLQGKRFDLSEGFLKQHVIIEECKLYSDKNNLIVDVRFSGSFAGTLSFTGTPFYIPLSQTIELQNFDYALDTKNFLLKGAKWLFNKIILEEIKKYTIVNLAAYYKKAADNINALLNKEWTKGIQAVGNVELINITNVQAQDRQLLIGCQCNCSLKLIVSEQAFKF